MSAIPAAAIIPADCAAAATAIRQIRPGQVVVYHSGNLPNDRRADGSLDELAADLWQLAQNEDRGGNRRPARLDLTQVKLRNGRYVYLATGRGPRLAAVK